MMFVPPVAAMVLPAALCLGTISFGAGALAVAILVGIAIAVTITSGRLYKMMSLYKGNNVKIGQALKMLFSGCHLPVPRACRSGLIEKIHKKI